MKYDGITDFAELKKINGIEAEKWSILVTIANELAEANRLKRLELIRNFGYRTPTIEEINEEV